MYQKCPMCNGSGTESKNPYPTSSTSNRCTVCEGTKIISQLNGLPPDLSVKFERNKVLREELEKKVDIAKDKSMYPLTEQEMFKPEKDFRRFYPQYFDDRIKLKQQSKLHNFDSGTDSKLEGLYINKIPELVEELNKIRNSNSFRDQIQDLVKNGFLIKSAEGEYKLGPKCNLNGKPTYKD